MTAAATAVDVVAHWRAHPGCEPRAPRGTRFGLGVYFEAPTAAAGKGKRARPAHPPGARLVGPVGGACRFTAAELRAEAAALVAAAALLDELNAAWHPETGTIHLTAAVPDPTLFDVEVA